MDNFYYVIIYSLAGLISVVIADIRKHLTDIRKLSAKIWWRDNRDRITIALALILAVQLIVRIAPDSSVIISASIGATIDVSNPMANYTLAIAIASMVLVAMKKPTTNNDLPNDNVVVTPKPVIDEEINSLQLVALELGKNIDFHFFDSKNTEHCEL